MKVLSIDFDYFVDADIKTRNTKFPNAEDITNPQEIIEMWEECYSKHEDIKDIGVNEDYDLMCNFLEEHRKVPILVMESHRFAYDFIKDIQMGSDTVLEIVNVDFHHDNYYMYGGKVTCANWLMKVCEETNTDNVLWVKRKDSETESLAGSFPYRMSNDLVDSFMKYDAIFICMSPEWTPPHLRPYYEKLVKCTGQLLKVSCTCEIDFFDL